MFLLKNSAACIKSLLSLSMPSRCQHPGGFLEEDWVRAVVSDQPICPAASSHIAAFSIHPYPLSAHVPEVTMGYTVVCRPGIVLHELLEASQNSPVVLASHVAVPHTQAPGLAAVPSVMAQGTKVQRLSLAKQNGPVVLASHVAVPHTQAPGLAAVPFVIKQEGNLLHRPMAALQ